MGQIKISDAAALLSVSDDTARRWVEQGRLSGLRDGSDARVVDGTELAATLVESGKELGLTRGSIATAVIKATNVTIEALA